MSRGVYKKTGIVVSVMSNPREYMRQWQILRRGWEPVPGAFGRVRNASTDGRLRSEDARITRWASKARKNLRASARVRGIEWSREITSAWIHEQMQRQGGRCFYTGVEFQVTASRRGLRRPSLDRIDSSKGYVPGNVVVCLVAVNYAKNDATAEELCEVLQAIVDANR